jgi:hypothetical protein
MALGVNLKIKKYGEIIIEFGEDEINDARVAIDGHKYKHAYLGTRPKTT